MSTFIVYLTAIILLILIGWLDYLTGHELRFFIFYYVPVALATWHLGWKSGVLVALLAVQVRFIIEQMHEVSFPPEYIQHINFALRLVSYLVIVFGLSHIKKALDREKELVAELNRTLGERELSEWKRAKTLRRLVNIQEEERSRLARELHDRLSQYLAALRIHIRALQVDAQGDERLSQLDVVTAELAREVAHMARELRPPALDEYGLEAALSGYVEEWSRRFGRGADFHADGLHGRRLPPDVETTVYRIVQEALTNVIKHSGAGCVSVIVRYGDGELSALVEDDGGGFDPAAVTNQPAGGKGLGLLGMRERAALAGGELIVEAAPGAGTTVVVRLPLPPEVGGAAG